MRVIKVPADPGQPISVIDINHHWTDMAEAIGGGCEYIERFHCPLTRTYHLVGVCDEEGQYGDQRANERAWPLYPMQGYYLRGDVLVVAEGMTPEGPDFIDLPNEDLAMSLVRDLLEGARHA